ncbi:MULTISPECIES: hypothetical protein [Paenibacillus]|uniref:hypothetical protein n=1 Tax=Paenibacillus TaxID=44249 RepID=UPI0003710334|nr:MULTISPECIES: hypothetical protein [Paenibacillus]
MTLGECLNQLHNDLLLIDLSRPGYPTRTVAELKKTMPLEEEGYEVRIRSFNFGRTQKRSIGRIDGPNLWNET